MKTIAFKVQLSKFHCASMTIMVLLTSILSEQVQAQPQFREQIIQSINEFVNVEAVRLVDTNQGRLTHRISGLDPRLHIQPCKTSVQIKPTQSNWLRKRSHLSASCDTPTWSLIIGLELFLYREVLVARTSIQKDDQLVGMTEFAEMDILALNSGSLENEKAIAGKVAKRSITMGQVIAPQLIKPQVLVPRNALVEVIAQIGTISVTSQGVALENGAFGDTIKVRNNRSKRVIEARVVKANQVEIVL